VSMGKDKAEPCGGHAHPDYAAELKRLNRISGQVDGVKRMIEQRRYCPDILAQLRAIRAAVHAVESNILGAHLDACVRDAFAAPDAQEQAEKIAELKALYRRFSE